MSFAVLRAHVARRLLNRPPIIFSFRVRAPKFLVSFSPLTVLPPDRKPATRRRTSNNIFMRSGALGCPASSITGEMNEETTVDGRLIWPRVRNLHAYIYPKVQANRMPFPLSLLDSSNAHLLTHERVKHCVYKSSCQQ